MALNLSDCCRLLLEYWWLKNGDSEILLELEDSGKDEPVSLIFVNDPHVKQGPVSLDINSWRNVVQQV